MPDRSPVVISLLDCVAQYDAHLLKVRGLSKSTRNLHRHVVHMLLCSSFPTGDIAWSTFCFGDVVQFVSTEFQRLTSRATQRVWLMVLRSFLRYTLTDDLAEQIAGEDENEQRTAEEVLLSAIDSLQDDKLTGFALRLALTGHIDIPREGEVDFLAEAEAVFASPQPKNAASKKPKVKTPTPIKAASKSAPKKAAAKKKTAA